MTLTPAPFLPPRHPVPGPARTGGSEPLWREVLGDLLRSVRHSRGETLGEIANRAGVSPQYLSEIERGRKDPSSEMIAAVAGALDLRLADLTVAAAARLITVPSPHQPSARLLPRVELALAA
ncbi:Helix-turn-helix domain-containing protein [Propionibacterium cyclohexanicum]|uniref:Helix-turn-helix domain-containing protein n=1 Tax=Propionibacterium cyclohexanicum TaxID=64702 RepID=A0A1H9U855_9ACTN|nr:helix-turn-helix transcriptional regulator [Propionibacterium cyclohexanicum]SES05646.1 Helix-turn-helix domain-containing protein [Propionibacterium cyclohexanicum]